ncbi:MAG: hypothetical protein VCC00_05245 [Deltaproteobacteria bacterium]
MSTTATPKRPELPNPNADHYRMEGSPRPMPRTTSVIDRGIGKPFLTKWAGNLERRRILAELGDALSEELTAEQGAAVLGNLKSRLAPDPYCEVEKNTAGAFGTAAHGLVEAYLHQRLGHEMAAADEAPAPLVARAAGLAIEWFEKVEFEPDPDGIEERLWSEDKDLWSAGTADAFGTANLGLMVAHSRWNRAPKEAIDPALRVPVLVDLKTSKSIGVSHKVQTAAYITYLIERGRIEKACHSCILRVAKTEEDPHPTEALLMHPDEFLRYGGAFRFIRRIFNFLSQEEELEQRHWREKRSRSKAR